MQITTTVEITTQQIANLMVTACEHNDMTASWCHKFWLAHPKKVPAAHQAEDDKGLVWYCHPWLYQQPDLAIDVEVDDPDEGGEDTLEKVIGLADIEQGLQIMAAKYPKHFRDITEDFDAITADVFLQCVVLGEVVYG